jgi:hypothetical protein
MPIGWQNPVPFEVGGGPTAEERAQRALLDAVGRGGAAADQDDSVDGSWRQAVAEALGVLSGYGEHALLQGFPHTASDGVETFEDVLRLEPPVDESVEDRRQAATARWVDRSGADCPSLSEHLEAIDPRLSLISDVEWDDEDTTVLGRTIGDSAESYGETLVGSSWPNYSGEFRIYVLFDTGSVDPLTATEQVIVQRAKDYLCEALPSVYDFAVITSRSFLVGTSPLGYTGA